MIPILRRLRIEILVSLLALVSCCGYSTKSLLPSHLKGVYIEIFENRTIKIELGEQMTKELVRQFNTDGSLRATSESRAQLKVKGSVSYFNKEPYVYSGDQTIYKYKITVKCNIQAIDLVKNEVYWEGEVSDWAILEQNQDEVPATNEAITKVAKEIVRRILINW